jgi:hypothetical protein
MGAFARPDRALAQTSAAIVDGAAFGLVGNGSDETAALRSAFDSGESLILRRGVYRSEEPLACRAEGQRISAGNRATRIVAPSLDIRANRVSVTDITLHAALTVVDSMFTAIRDVHVFRGGIRLETRVNTDGNGTYFTELANVEIEEGAIGLHVTGVAAGANRIRAYGLTVGWCTVGIKLQVGDTFTAWQPQITGCEVGLWIPSPLATASMWVRPTFEGNLKHIHIDQGTSDHTFLFPSFSAPGDLGVDHGVRTNWLLTDTSNGRPSILTGQLHLPNGR